MESTEDEETSERSKGVRRSRLNKLKQLQFRRRYYDRDLYEGFVSRGASENEAGKLNHNESVTLAGIWVAEIFLPSSIEALREGVDALGWRQGRLEDDDIDDWIVESRRGQGGSWRSLGLISSSQNPHFMAKNTTDLPKGVRGIFPALHSVSAGLSALSVLFVFEDGVGAELTKVVNADYKAWQEDIRPSAIGKSRLSRLAISLLWRTLPHWLFQHSQSLHMPSRDRSLAVQDFLRNQRLTCSEWVSDRFRGSLSNGLDNRELPSIQLCVTEQDDPKSPSEDNREGFETIGLATRFNDTWISPQWPAARLWLPHSFVSGTSDSLMLACRRDDAYELDKGFGDERSDWSVAQFADMQVQGLLLRWAISRLLTEHQNRLADLRDIAPREAKEHRPVRSMKKVRQTISTESIDLEVACREIKRLANDVVLFNWDVMQFEQAEATTIGEKTFPIRKLSEEWRQWQLREASDRVDELRIVVQSSSTVSNLSAAISSTRLQRLVIVLTALSIGIASWALVQSSHDANNRNSPRPVVNPVRHR